MRQIWIITKRELNASFDSLMAYILIIAFLAFTGFFTWLYGTDVFLTGQASLQSFFSTAYWTLFFFVPAMTMKMIAEERKTGTLELLLTKSVTDAQVLWGKFFGALMQIGIALLLTVPYYITVSFLGNIDHSAVLCGYLGLVLMSASYISIGLFASSLTSNQIVAFLVALFIGIFFHFLFGILAQTGGLIGRVLDYLSITSHYQSVIRGVLDTKDIVFFVSIVVLGVVAAGAVLARRKLD